MSREMKDSGVEWIGKIPENWDTIPLKRLSKIQTGSSPDKKEGNNNYSDESGIPWIKAENLGEFFPIHSTSEYLTENGCKLGRIYPPYTVYVCCIASIGKVGFSDIECSCNQQINGLSFNNIVNWKFGFYETLASAIEHIARSNKSVTPILNATEEGKIKFAIPSPTEQQQIVHFLDRKCTAIDTAIEKTKKSIEKLEEYKKAVITKAVTKGIDPNAKMKDSGVEWIGEMPEGWEITRNKFYVIISHGMDPKTEGDIPVYGSGAESFKSCGEYKEGPAVLLGRKGATLHIPHYITGKYWNVDTAFDVKTKSEDMGLKYFYFLSMCFNYNYYIAKTTLPSMTQFDYCNMRIPLPSRKEQDIIVSYIEDKCVAIDTAIEKEKKAIEKWEEYKKSLIYYAVTGKIDCRNEVI